jgi:adenylate cyclase
MNKQTVKRNPIVITLVLSIAVFLFTLVIIHVERKLVRSPFSAIDNVANDIASQVRNYTHQDSRYPLSDFVIVDIDDYSIDVLGRVQYWPRKYDAMVIDYIAKGEPGVIIVDFFYTESDSLPDIYLSMLADQGFENGQSILAALRSDHQLANAIGNAGNVILGLLDDNRIEPEWLSERSDALEFLPFVLAHPAVVDAYYKTQIPRLPVNEFVENALSLGILKVRPDYDGSIRSYIMLQHFSGEAPLDRTSEPTLPSVSLVAGAHLLGLPFNEISVDSEGLHLGELFSIPINRNGEFRLNWLGKSEQFRYIPFARILSEEVPADFFRNKIVFLGSSAAGLADLKNIPNGRIIPGVEVHATALYNILNQTWLKEIPIYVYYAGLFVIGIFVVLVFLNTSYYVGFFMALSMVAVQFLIYVLFVVPEFNVIIPFSSILLITSLGILISLVHLNATEGKEKRRLKRNFESYVSPKLVKQIIDSGEDPSLGGNESVITAFFSDIQDFSTISEKMTPSELVDMMNEYLDRMTHVINDEDGTLDKYIGDAIVAFYGAPAPMENHALNACSAACKILDAEKVLINEWRVSGRTWPEAVFGIRTRIGLNTGLAVTGNMGSKKRFNYTMMGDTVNLAARCESIAKKYGVYCMVTERTAREANSKGDKFLFRIVDSVVVAGKTESVRIYELLGNIESVSEQQKTCVALYEQGFSAYQQKQWMQAIALFEKSAVYEQEVVPEGDKKRINPSVLMSRRCAQYVSSPPPESWNGSHSYDTK